MNKDLVEDIKKDEGFVSHVYKDHLGYYTIGYGFLVDERRGGGLSTAECEFILRNRLQIIFSKLDREIPWWGRLSETQQRGLANMAYQLGVKGLLRFKNTLELMRIGKYKEAAQEALNSRWAQQTPDRAKRVADMLKDY